MLEIKGMLGMLDQVAPHMSTDSNLPGLCGVQLEADGGTVYAVATDRYTMAVSRRSLDHGHATWSAWLPRETVNRIRAFLTDCAGRIDVEMRRGRLTIAAAGRRMTVDAAVPVWIWIPRWRPVVTAALTAAPSLDREVGLSVSFLARWGHIAGPHTKLTVWATGPRKPLVLAAGSDFIGLHMPLPSYLPAYTERQAIQESWAHLTKPAPAAAPRPSWAA